jgi:N-acetyl-gamma-glutamyl-phosphate reductase
MRKSNLKTNSKFEIRNSKLRIGIFGGSGYGGSELLRILLQHPNAEIALVTANEHAGKAVSEVHRNLYGLTDLVFSSAPEDLASLNDFDCVFLALPHGQAMDVVPRLPEHLKIIDLSGDFRLVTLKFLQSIMALPTQQWTRKRRLFTG